MMTQQKRELKLMGLQQSVNEMKTQDIRCNEMQRILRKAGQQMKMRRMYVEFEQEQLYSNLQKVLSITFKTLLITV